MRLYFLLYLCLTIIISCKNKSDQQKTTSTPSELMNYAIFGDTISADHALSASVMAEKYASMSVGDSIDSKVMAKVDEVCQAKGCWMKLNLDDGNQVMVRFKNYGFFMPKDIAGQEVIIEGVAFLKETSVDELRHYAEDAGQTAEEIATITQPKKTYSFEAYGVLLNQ